MSIVTHILAAMAGCTAGIAAICMLHMRREADFVTTSDWEPDPLPAAAGED